MLIHLGTQSIETSRLILRRFRQEDAHDMYYNWASDPQVCKFLLWGPHSSIESSERRIRQWLEGYELNYTYVWAICLKNSNMAIGSVSVEISKDSAGACEVGYCIGRDYWSRGIMTEALIAVLHYLLYEVGYRKIYARHDTLNAASGMVMQKAGMNYVKTEHRVGIRRDGTYYDCAVYEKSILED